ncbi:MAG TPA: VOC family protein [Terriglobales bacterium]|nr:VOC family protein [Terriglobales bacterium]
MSSIALSWSPQGSFHHVGFVVSSIQNTIQQFMQSLKAEWDRDIVHDPLQQVSVTFLRGQNPADPLFELIEPAGEQSPVMSFLKRGGGLHHVCYLSDDMENELATCRQQGTLVVKPPLPATAFGGRRIAWVYTKNKLLIEYLER